MGGSFTSTTGLDKVRFWVVSRGFEAGDALGLTHPGKVSFVILRMYSYKKHRMEDRIHVGDTEEGSF